MLPLLYLTVFLAASFLMIWRLEAMAAQGMEGTVLGTLIMPYCTGMGNLVFAWIMAAKDGSGADVVTNCLVNNVTNLTLLLGLPIGLWGMRSSVKLDRRAVVGTIVAVLLFTAAAWILPRGGAIRFGGGVVLVALFLTWQAWHIAAAVKSGAGRGNRYAILLAIDLGLLLACSYAIYISTDWLSNFVSNIKTGFISAKYLGWLSGWLDVLPNGSLAFYYGWKRRAEVVYTSQIGDGHICIPLCLGLYALYRPLETGAFFNTGVLILVCAALVHLAFVGFTGRLPRWVGWLLVAAYGYFLYAGLVKK